MSAPVRRYMGKQIPSQYIQAPLGSPEYRLRNKYGPMKLEWKYQYPDWAKGLPESSLKTIPKEFCPRRPTNPLYPNRWYKPEMNARTIAKLRKNYVLAGLEWPWEKPGRRGLVRISRPCKGTKRSVEKAARLLAIAAKMKEMPKKLDEARAARAARKESRRVDWWSLVLRAMEGKNLRGRESKGKQ